MQLLLSMHMQQIVETSLIYSCSNLGVAGNPEFLHFLSQKADFRLHLFKWITYLRWTCGRLIYWFILTAIELRNLQNIYGVQKYKKHIQTNNMKLNYNYISSKSENSVTNQTHKIEEALAQRNSKWNKHCIWPTDQ